MPPKAPPLQLHRIEDRLATFLPIEKPKGRARGGWPLSAESHPKLTPQHLAEAGFYFAPNKASGTNSDNCICFACGVVLGGWKPKDNPHKEHVDRGNCAWAETVCQAELDSSKKGKKEYATLDDLPSSATWTFVRENTFYSAHRETCYWPHIANKKFKVTPHALASAGFIFTGSALEGGETSDSTRCVLCDYEVLDWEADDDPLEVHRNKHADCPFFTAKVGVKAKRAPRTTKKVKAAVAQEEEEGEEEAETGSASAPVPVSAPAKTHSRTNSRSQPARTRQQTSEAPSEPSRPALAPKGKSTRTTAASVQASGSTARSRRGKKEEAEGDDIETIEEDEDEIIILDGEDEEYADEQEEEEEVVPVPKVRAARKTGAKGKGKAPARMVEQEQEEEQEQEHDVMEAEVEEPKTKPAKSTSLKSTSSSSSASRRKTKAAAHLAAEEEIPAEQTAEEVEETEVEEVPLAKSTKSKPTKSRTKAEPKPKSVRKPRTTKAKSKPSSEEIAEEGEIAETITETNTDSRQIRPAAPISKTSKPSSSSSILSTNTNPNLNPKSKSNTSKNLPPLPTSPAAQTQRPLSQLDRFANIPSSPAPAPVARITKALPSKKATTATNNTAASSALDAGAKAARAVVSKVLDAASTPTGPITAAAAGNKMAMDVTVEEWIKVEMSLKKAEIEREGMAMIAAFEERTREARRRIDSIPTRAR